MKTNIHLPFRGNNWEKVHKHSVLDCNNMAAVTHVGGTYIIQHSFNLSKIKVGAPVLYECQYRPLHTPLQEGMLSPTFPSTKEHYNALAFLLVSTTQNHNSEAIIVLHLDSTIFKEQISNMVTHLSLPRTKFHFNLFWYE